MTGVQTCALPISKDSRGRTALTWAARGGYEAVVRLLIERGDVDINSKDSDGRTALTLAAEKGHDAIVRLLNDRHGMACA